MLYPPKNGAYTELFAGLSDTIDEKDNGGWRKSCDFVLVSTRF